MHLSHVSSSQRFMVFVLVITLIGLIAGLAADEGHAQSSVTIYSDSLPAGWQNWSWNTTLDFNQTDQIHSGSAALAATYTTAWAGLYLHRDSSLNLSAYDTLRFWIHGGSSGGHQLNIRLVDSADTFIASPVTVTTQANSWSLIEIPLADLGSPTLINGLVWQETSGGAQPLFYLDAIELVNSGLPPTAPPPPTGGPSLTVDAGASQHLISPHIYGLNFADPALAADLRLPVNRWGGNATTRYNWQNDTSNRASDWYFENVPNDNTNPAALPNGSASDQFVAQNQTSGTDSLLTIPLIGWTPKSRDYACGFSVTLYGNQQDSDPYRPDCGNGRAPGGANLVGNNPLDTSTAITETFVQEWLTHLIGRYGSAASGGVKFYNLDNEPMLWSDTHRDVHPAPVSYDELRDRTVQYAAALKAVDPQAQTLGPALWGWTAYFYSTLDWAGGGSWWLSPPDRTAHGGTPFVEWYLQQMQAYEQSQGVRLLDYLDLHFYPQGGQALTTAGDADRQALRLRSTRALWDPTYSDESWINEPVYLIPRMRAWVDTHYPGTKLALSEYNWGGLEHINGALAQADILGIFGRERLDLATLWAPPDFYEPGAFAFRMYRNYDGAGSAFGEQSLAATSSDQAKLSIYAARRSSDAALTIMVINKSGESLQSTLTISGVTTSWQAHVYRYGPDNLGQIVPLPAQVVSSSFTADFPANAISLYVLQAETGINFSNYLYLPHILVENQ